MTIQLAAVAAHQLEELTNESQPNIINQPVLYTVILINVYETNQNLDMKKGFKQPKNAFQLAGTGEHLMPGTF